MYRLKENILVVVMALSCAVADTMTQVGSVLSPKLTRCTHERAYDMYGAYCAGLKLEKIPSLKSSIEILDFSENRLSDIQADTFNSYTHIKFLYLADNPIYKIDKDAFASLPYLQTLDLSNTVILDLPGTIFQLPSLRNLYLKNNPLLHLHINDIILEKPIKAPLEFLDLSNCKLEALPNWGTLPHLMRYNISNNPLKTLEAQQFAAMCNLKKVDISNSIEKINLCDMKSTITWFQLKSIYFELDDYTKLNTKEFDDCSVTSDNWANLNTTYVRCKDMYMKYRSVHSSRRTWLTVTGGLAGFLVGFMLLLYLMHRHNVAQTKTPAEKIKKVTPKNDKDSNAIVPILQEASDVSRL